MNLVSNVEASQVDFHKGRTKSLQCQISFVNSFFLTDLINHLWQGLGLGTPLFDMYMDWRSLLLEIPEAGFRGRSDSRVKWEGSIAFGWLDWGCMGVLAGGVLVMNRVFDYLRLALKGRTKTLGQRLRASQLSYRMPGPVLVPLRSI